MPAVSADPVLLAAGDIGDCTSAGDEATAALRDTLDGTVAALGDTAYMEGTADQFARCYDPTTNSAHPVKSLPLPTRDPQNKRVLARSHIDDLEDGRTPLIRADADRHVGRQILDRDRVRGLGGCPATGIR